MSEAKLLAASRRGAMIAAAGCGKTYLIARAVSEYGRGRELILTHTNVGVDALRQNLRRMNVPSSSYRVDTIASWALRLAKSFPSSSELITPSPRHDEWDDVYGAATKLLDRSAIREIVRASYSGIYVDEYQDCTLD